MNETPNLEVNTTEGELSHADLNPEELAAKVAAESVKSWEKTFLATIFGYNNETKIQFENNLDAFILNVEFGAHPDLPDTDDGDEQFYHLIQKVKQLLKLCKEGHTIDKLEFLLDEIKFQDTELDNKINRLFRTHYAAK